MGAGFKRREHALILVSHGFGAGWIALGLLIIYTVYTMDEKPILMALLVMCAAIVLSLLLFTTSKGGR